MERRIEGGGLQRGFSSGFLMGGSLGPTMAGRLRETVAEYAEEIQYRTSGLSLRKG